MKNSKIRVSGALKQNAALLSVWTLQKLLASHNKHSSYSVASTGQHRLNGACYLGGLVGFLSIKKRTGVEHNNETQ